MGASSVTGVGQGSADKAGQKGSEHLFVGVEKLIGTRIVLSGYVTLTSNSPSTATVKLPQQLPGNFNSTFDGSANASDYLVFISPYNDATHDYSVTSMATNSGVNSFVITGPNSVTTVVFWQVVRHSGASVTAYPTHN